MNSESSWRVDKVSYFVITAKEDTSALSNCTSKFVQNAKGIKMLLLGHFTAAQGGETCDRPDRGVLLSALKIKGSCGSQCG